MVVVRSPNSILDELRFTSVEFSPSGVRLRREWSRRHPGQVPGECDLMGQVVHGDGKSALRTALHGMRCCRVDVERDAVVTHFIAAEK